MTGTLGVLDWWLVRRNLISLSAILCQSYHEDQRILNEGEKIVLEENFELMVLRALEGRVAQI